MWLVVFFTILALGHHVLALYPPSSDVVDLTPSNFQSKVINSDDVWIVEFYAPWCGHCKQLVPEYQKAATALKGVVKVGAVNADEHRDLGGKYGVRGFPTLKVFGANKQSPSDYQGGRTADGIVDAGLRELKNVVNQRLTGKKSSGGSGGGGSSSGDPKDVIELTDSNFDKLVLNSEDMWLVEFYAPWCGHCKNLAPHWAQAATELKGKVKLGALDATVHTVKSSQYGVQGFPTIKYFGPGVKDSSSVKDYDGGRTASDIVNWAKDQLAENVPAPEVVQLISEDVLEAECSKKPLCVVAVLPNILDCQSECRNEYISTLAKLGEKYKKKMWGWIWVEGAVQTDLESALELGGFGYPALSAVNAKKKVYANLRGAFSYDGINEFLRALSYGKTSTSTLGGAKIPPVIATEPWDGKDGVLEVEEDIDLSDIELEPLDKDEL